MSGDSQGLAARAAAVDADRTGDFLKSTHTDELERSTQTAKHKSTAVLRFNTKPLLGVEYLRGMGLWDGSPELLAAWIDLEVVSGGLSKRRVGEFFGGTLPLAAGTFECWLARCVGRELGPGVALDCALRTLLRRFRLPGEAQCIDRVMEGFARAFKRANPVGSARAWPHSEDAAYVLAFSLVMLNTDLHSKSIKDADRMTEAGFVSNNRGIDEGGRDLPAELLRELYAGVKREEITMDEGDLYESELITYMGARKAGWLEKGNKSLTGALKWHRLWFVLNDGCLYYFRSPSDAAVESMPPRAIVPLDQGLDVVRPTGAAPGREFALVRRRASFDGASKLSSPAVAIKAVKHHGNSGKSVGTATEILLRARDVADAAAWADALRAEEESLPTGSAHATAARAAAHARERRLSSRASSPTMGDCALPLWKQARQDNSHTPLLAGKLRKRGEINTAWKVRYFALFSGVTCTAVEGETPPADEPVLMYFKDEGKFRELVAGGSKPYKGAVRLGHVKEMKRKRAQTGSGKPAILALVTKNRTWLLAPLDDSAEHANGLDPWWYALEGACHAAQLGSSARTLSGSSCVR